MMRVAFGLLVCAVAAATVMAAPRIPATPAGHTLQAWLDAFNSGDAKQIATYVATYGGPDGTDELVQFRAQTGGFELLAIDRSERLQISFRVKEKAGPTTAVGKITVKDADPAAIVSFSLRAIPPGLKASDMDATIDAATRTQVIDGIVAKLDELYVYPETAKKMEAAVRAHQKSGDYNAIVDGEEFAALLTEHLRAVSHDKHLRVDWVPRKLPAKEPPPDPKREAEMRAMMERDNCGFRKVEQLPGNIGYLKFDVFGDPSVCGATASAAMGFVANVDALIIDLRENGGGAPDMVAYVSTYLFDEPTHLNDIYDRKQDTTTQHWTLPYVTGKRLGDKPVYVLVSNRTFSGAEEFTYNLKNLKRATIVGETTGGGAHPVAGQRVADHFVIGVPFARAVSPITKTNWEGTGVEPDVKVPAADALDKAKQLALEKLRQTK